MKSTKKIAPNILLINSKTETSALLKKELKLLKAKLLISDSPKNILKLILKYDFSVILVDTHTRNLNIVEIIKIIQKNESTENVPIIFINKSNKIIKYMIEEETKRTIDYLFKPLDPIILRSKISVFLDHYHYEQEINILKNNLKKTHHQLKNSKREQTRLMNCDTLTNLPNRKKFKKNILKAISLVKKNFLALLFIDLDKFNQVNDTLGHDIGDLLLKEVSK